MLRYFYLLCILLAIEWSLCYDDILDGKVLRYNYEERPYRKHKIHERKNRFESRHNAIKSRPKYEVVDAKEPIAQIDVASFIHKPDEYAVEDNSLYERETKKSKNKMMAYNDFEPNFFKFSLAEDTKLNDMRPYLNLASEDKVWKSKDNPISLEDSINTRYSKFMPEHRWEQKKIARNLEANPSINNRNHPYRLSNIETSLNHNPEKKCALKYLRFPFFSHNKNETQKLKKNKKRKIFCFNCSKKDSEESRASTEANEIVKENEKKEFTEHSIDHGLSKKTTENILQTSVKVSREKREDDWLANKERQLKEIEDIQNKIDHVEIKQMTPKI